MVANYRIIKIYESVQNEKSVLWRKAFLENINDDSNKFWVNLNPHVASAVSAVIVRDDGSLGDAFLLVNQSKRGTLNEWIEGDIVSIDI